LILWARNFTFIA